MSNYQGRLYYKKLEPAAYFEDVAFDGSVPYGSVTSGFISFEDTSGTGSSSTVYFSLVGPAKSSYVPYGSAGSYSALQTVATVKIRDFWMNLSGEGSLLIAIAVCDPSNPVPTSSADASYLFWTEVTLSPGGTVVPIRIPDIDHLAIAASASQPLNVCILFRANATNSTVYCNYHCNCIVDD